MTPFAAINLPSTVSHFQFRLRLVTIMLLRSVTVGHNLPWLICYQPVIIITINIYIVVSVKKKLVGQYSFCDLQQIL